MNQEGKKESKKGIPHVNEEEFLRAQEELQGEEEFFKQGKFIPFVPGRCKCGNPSGETVYQDNNKCACGVKKHHYHCADCGAITQTG